MQKKITNTNFGTKSKVTMIMSSTFLLSWQNTETNNLKREKIYWLIVSEISVCDPFALLLWPCTEAEHRGSGCIVE